MSSPTLINYTKSNLYADVSKFCEDVISNIDNGLLKKKYTNILWFLTESISLLGNYEYYYPEFNLLTDTQYNNILKAIEQILNKEYYEFN